MENTAEGQVENGQQEQGQQQGQETGQQTQQTANNGTNDAPDWVRGRMGELAAKRRAAEERAAAEADRANRLEQELAALRAGGDGQQVQQTHQAAPNPQNFEQLVRHTAEQLVTQQRRQETIANQIGAIEKAGKEAFGDQFTTAVGNLQMAGIQSDDFLTALTAVQNPEKVIAFLGQNDNVGEAIRIANLSPVQMGIEMSKISAQAIKHFGKQISKAPAPLSTVEGGSSADGAEPKLGTPEWYEWRNKTARRRK
jgi:hypothetical protein